ncbi:hypothetical protein Anas_02334 [Armadillidium nasatum]|uniref:Uncharacterized protein n=1 Tax=Armadillidium nasatum TaxID=96803 RepID=A0A5N5TKA8_9CRUS|nr:hypothetical protein Anas_02334 [Armadillidium nasatum]
MIQRECHCSNSINDLLLALQSDLPRCNPTNLTQDLCRQLQIKKSTTDRKLCDVIYTPLISTNYVNTKFFNIVKNVKGIYVGDDVCSQ